MLKISRALTVALLLAAPGCSDDVPAGTTSDLRAELSNLRERIAEAKETAQRFQGGEIGALAARRREVLLLSAAMLENRLIAEEGGVPSKITAPALTTNPARAKQILRHISATEEAIDQAKQEAAESKGVAGKLAQARVLTDELTLAQLQLAFYQAAFGLALSGESHRSAAAERASVATGLPDGGDGRPTAPRQEKNLREAIPDIQEAGPPDTPINRVISRSPSGKDADGIVIEELPAPPPGSEAKLARGDQDGDASNQRAQRDGVEDGTSIGVPEQPPRRPAPPQLSREDYVRLQLQLQEAGFNPGAIDGRWGPQTERALANFQRARGLPNSGRPDAVTLDALDFR